MVFRFDDREQDTESVTLVQEVAWPRTGPAFSRVGAARWEVGFGRPPVDRFEYRFEVVRGSGEHALILDPANPCRAPGAFGERSVIEFPEYRAPSWVASEVSGGEVLEVALPAPRLGREQPALLWSPVDASAGEPLPLLVALDGMEYARYSGLVHMLDVCVADSSLPRMRALLLQPTERDAHYTASPDFAWSLAHEVIPAAEQLVAVTPGPNGRVGLGASLGGLALLHAHRLEPEAFGALFIQSSSLMHHGYMPGFVYFDRIEKFVNEVLASGFWRSPIRITMTCGVVEQNLANNRDVVAALCEQGYRAELHVMRDAHNWIGWRDAWTPHLCDLLRETWG